MEIDEEVRMLKKQNEDMEKQIKDNKAKITELISSDPVFHTKDETPVEGSNYVYTPNKVKVYKFRDHWYFNDCHGILVKVDKWCYKEDYRW